MLGIVLQTVLIIVFCILLICKSFMYLEKNAYMYIKLELRTFSRGILLHIPCILLHSGSTETKLFFDHKSKQILKYI